MNSLRDLLLFMWDKIKNIFLIESMSKVTRLVYVCEFWVLNRRQCLSKNESEININVWQLKSKLNDKNLEFFYFRWNFVLFEWLLKKQKWALIWDTFLLEFNTQSVRIGMKVTGECVCEKDANDGRHWMAWIRLSNIEWLGWKAKKKLSLGILTDIVLCDLLIVR